MVSKNAGTPKRVPATTHTAFASRAGSKRVQALLGRSQQSPGVKKQAGFKASNDLFGPASMIDQGAQSAKVPNSRVA